MPSSRFLVVIVLLELGFAVAAIVAGAFAFLPLFADHQPFPGIWSNDRVVAFTAVLALAAVDVAMILGIDRWMRRQQRPSDHHRLIRWINSLWAAITALPVLMALVAGGT